MSPAVLLQKYTGENRALVFKLVLSQLCHSTNFEEGRWYKFSELSFQKEGVDCVCILRHTKRDTLSVFWFILKNTTATLHEQGTSNVTLLVCFRREFGPPVFSEQKSSLLSQYMECLCVVDK